MFADRAEFTRCFAVAAAGAMPFTLYVPPLVTRKRCRQLTPRRLHEDAIIMPAPRPEMQNTMCSPREPPETLRHISSRSGFIRRDLPQFAATAHRRRFFVRQLSVRYVASRVDPFRNAIMLSDTRQRHYYSAIFAHYFRALRYRTLPLPLPCLQRPMPLFRRREAEFSLRRAAPRSSARQCAARCRAHHVQSPFFAAHLRYARYSRPIRAS